MQEKLLITQLDEEKDVLSEHLSCRVSPMVRKQYEEIALATSRGLTDVVRIALVWALEHIEVVKEEIEEL